MARTRPPYPAEFREQMIELARAGTAPAELAGEFGVTAQKIANWFGADGRDARRGKTGADALSNAESEELVRLRRRLHRVQMERDILAKAMAWFTAKGDKSFNPSSSS